MTPQKNRPSVSFPDLRGDCNPHEGSRYPVDRVSRPSTLKLLLLALVGALTISGCGFDVYQLPLRGGTELPDNAVASIRQTSLLGEKFVSLAAPESGASTEPLASGDVIPLERSGRNPEVEEVLGALSLLLNG